ncbi:MAG: hypothetical protein ACO3JL_12835 [Myxococcota bacterium]
MGHTGMHRGLVTALVGVCLAPCMMACTEDSSREPAKGATGVAVESAELVYRRVPGAPFELEIPSAWKLEPVVPGPLPPPPAEPATDDGGAPAATAGAASAPPLALQSRVLLSARAPVSGAGMRVSAQLLVQHDPWLPQGTTASDYLAAQRASNRAAVADLRHVEAEFSRRQGRPAYYVRDEWAAPLGKDATQVFSQETLLLLDAEDERLHGYSVTITLPIEDRAALAAIVRQILDGLRFPKR